MYDKIIINPIQASSVREIERYNKTHTHTLQTVFRKKVPDMNGKNTQTFKKRQSRESGSLPSSLSTSWIVNRGGKERGGGGGRGRLKQEVFTTTRIYGAPKPDEHQGRDASNWMNPEYPAQQHTKTRPQPDATLAMRICFCTIGVYVFLVFTMSKLNGLG